MQMSLGWNGAILILGGLLWHGSAGICTDFGRGESRTGGAGLVHRGNLELGRWTAADAGPVTATAVDETGLGSDDQAKVAEAVPDPELVAKLEKYLSGATLRGRYTVLGNDVPPAEEEYTIQSAKKLPEGDQWLLEARIKYGKFDVTVPLSLAIKWADKTPVITVEKLTIPGMGTFSARVLFHNEMYSGTWSHDDVRGHLFGRVIPRPAEERAEPPGR